MSERPIIMSAESVRAILAGTKSQTRRLVSTREPLDRIGPAGDDSPDAWGYAFESRGRGLRTHGWMVLGRGHDQQWNNGMVSIPCPLGEVGGNLYVKETWCTGLSLDAKSPADIGMAAVDAGYRKPWAPVRYVADGREVNADVLRDFGGDWGRGRSPLHLPRWASRITLELTEVRVQRLQAITEEDAIAEGVPPVSWDRPVNGLMSSYVEGYKRRWAEINGKRSPWASNEFVWVLTFRRVSP